MSFKTRYHMINNLFVFLPLSIVMLLVEESLLAVLMILELSSIVCFFIILTLNLEMVGYSSITITLLTIQVSESVLSLGFFVNLMRFSSSEKISSIKMLKF